MAWTAVDPVAIGNATKRSQYDALWDNADYLYGFLGARTLFTFENVAPTGWDIVSGCTDSLLSTKGGANAYNVAGGSKLQGTWTQPGHTHTGYSHLHSTSGHVLTVTEIPSHLHTVAAYIANTAGSVAGSNTSKNRTVLTGTEDAGDGDSHTHGNTSTGGTAASSSDATAATWRPLANVGILIEHSGGEAGWDTTNPVAIGAPTKKDDYDSLWDNFEFVYDFIAGRKPFLFEDTAPTGWAIIAGCTDGLIAIKGGTGAYNIDGGTALQGTWTQPNHSHTRAAHTHPGGEHAVTVAEMATHAHAFSPYGFETSAGTSINLDSGNVHDDITVTGSYGGDSSHSHIASSGGNVSTAVGASANTWRPLANIGILVEKT